MNSDAEKQMGTKRCSDLTKLSPVFNLLNHRLAIAGFPQKTGHRRYNLVLRNICGERLCCDGFLVHGLGSFSGHVESYTAEEETPSSTAKALHVLPSRDYQSPIARRSDGKDLYSRTLGYVRGAIGSFTFALRLTLVVSNP